MPFTFSHPAIVLPFLKNNKFSATGLIIGTMSPDFEYFIRMKMQSTVSHSFLGLLTFNLPVGLFVAILFHQVIKKPLLENLPLFLQNRLLVVKNLDWIDYLKTNFFKVIISILLGAISHIFWDSFTHKSGYFVDQIAILQSEIMNIPFYKIMQHLSSLIGLLFMLFYFYKTPSDNELRVKPIWKYWIIVCGFGIVLMLLRFSFGLNQIGDIIVSIIAATILAITIASLIFRNKKFI